MGLRIRFQYPTAASLAYSIERLTDGSLFDFADSTFKVSPATPLAPLVEDIAPFAGRYRASMSATPQSQFSDGDYAVAIHNVIAQNVVVGLLGSVMHSGDDATVFPATPADPWSVNLPGSYATGSAGSLLGLNIDAKISTRSTYSGGPVASVAAPVTVGTNNDKSGYRLSGSGLDAIVVENGINARQALAPILAASAGSLSGAGTGTIVIRGANSTASRITATTDNAGNRSSVALSLPT